MSHELCGCPQYSNEDHDEDGDDEENPKDIDYFEEEDEEW